MEERRSNETNHGKYRFKEKFENYVKRHRKLALVKIAGKLKNKNTQNTKLMHKRINDFTNKKYPHQQTV